MATRPPAGSEGMKTDPYQAWTPGIGAGTPDNHAAAHSADAIAKAASPAYSNPYWQELDAFFEEDKKTSFPWGELFFGACLGAAITVGALWGYRWLENERESPLYKRTANQAIDPRQLELKIEDIDHTGVNRTILRYEGKPYLFMIGKDNKPEMRPYSVRLEQAGQASEKNERNEKQDGARKTLKFSDLTR